MSLNYFSSQDCYLLTMRQNRLFESHELTHGRIIYKQKNRSGRKKLGILFNDVVEIAGAWLEDIKIVPGSSIQNQDNYHHAEAVK